MAVPTVYTETTLKTYMHGRLGNMAAALKWVVDDGTGEGDYDEALNDTLFAYGQTDISQITGADNIRLLRAYSKFFLWKSVAEATINEIDYTHADSGATYKHSQMHKHAKEMMNTVADEIAALGGDVSGYAVDWHSIAYTDDLYTADDATLSSDYEWRIGT